MYYKPEISFETKKIPHVNNHQFHNNLYISNIYLTENYITKDSFRLIVRLEYIIDRTNVG